MIDRDDAVSAVQTDGAPTGWGALVAGRSVVFALIGVALAGWAGGSAAWGDWSSLAASIVLWAALLGAVLWAVVANGSGKFRVDLRLVFLPSDIAIALLCGVALRSIAVLSEMAAQGLRAPQLPGLFLFDGGLSPVVWVTMIIAPVAIAPFAEELFFRGVLQPSIGHAAAQALRVSRQASSVIAVVVTAALFAGGHLLMNPAAQPLLTGGLTFLVGLACGALTVLTGRIGPAIGIHLVFNASGVALLLVGTFG